MAESDLPEALRLERSSGQAILWSADEFRQIVRAGGLVPVVLADPASGRLLAYLVLRHANAQGPLGYCLLVAMVVDAGHRRQGYGRTLAIWCQTADEPFLTGHLGALVRESDLPAQQFLAACRFRCVGISPDSFDNPDEPGYEFAWAAEEDPVFRRPRPAAVLGVASP